ncbi:MAG: hypothetical protein RJA70_1363 [Pseudomonadota bacterium]|jgi:hypothetical protein
MGSVAWRCVDTGVARFTGGPGLAIYSASIWPVHFAISMVRIVPISDLHGHVDLVTLRTGRARRDFVAIGVRNLMGRVATRLGFVGLLESGIPRDVVRAFIALPVAAARRLFRRARVRFRGFVSAERDVWAASGSGQHEQD